MRGRFRTPIPLVATAVWALIAAPLTADDATAARRAEAIVAAAARAELLWEDLANSGPPPTLRSRDLFAAALALAEARRHPERIDRFLELGAAMQDRNPDGPHAGNFRWSWHDAEVTDTNAVEFCSFDMHLLWRRHRDWLPEPARQSLRGLLDRAVDASLRRAVPPTYTNIAILNAANLITLGEALDRHDAAAEGYHRLEAIAADTWQWGLHEYCSPAYYAFDIRGLSVIERHAERAAGRDLARAMVELVWTDTAVNFFPAAGRIAGPHSRGYDLLHGRGGLGQDLRLHGWIDVPVGRSLDLVDAAQPAWEPPQRLLDLARTRFPRRVRQAWGPRPVESRTHWLQADVTLGCAHAAYGDHDAALTFDLPGSPSAVRGVFVPDGREDPYGQSKEATGAAGLRKPVHLTPFWAAAQHDSDAVGLAVYRQTDLADEEFTNLQSHVVMPRDVDAIWLGERRLHLPASAPQPPARFPLVGGEPLVIRKGSAAVGLRVVWARRQDGGPAPTALVDDGAARGAMRLTIEHRAGPPTSEAAAAVWVRVGGGLASDDAFAAWQTQFLHDVARVDAAADRIHVAVPGREGPVAVTAHAPFTAANRVEIEPPPSRAVLELDGVDIGRPLLERADPCASLAAAFAAQRPLAVPADGGLRIEAEEGVVLPRMLVSDDGGSQRSVWQPAGPTPAYASGSTTWRIHVGRAGRYWLWGRTLAPAPSHDSFRLTVTGPDGRLLQAGDWHVPRAGDWRWSPIALDDARGPAPLDLPAGDVRLTIACRERGTKLDALWLTADPDGRPDD